jgi:hypothetical protein
MDYKKIYDQLIVSRKILIRHKNDGVYYERHHIIPKSIGGLNKKENLVLLTAKEHYIAHYLLYMIYKNTIHNKKMTNAFWRMNCIKNTNRLYTISSRIYNFIRQEQQSIASDRFKDSIPWNKGLTKETSNSLKSVSISNSRPKTKKEKDAFKQAWKFRSKTQSAEHTLKSSLSRTGLRRTTQSKINMSIAANNTDVKYRKLINNPKWSGFVYVYNTNNILYKKFLCKSHTTKELKCKTTNLVADVPYIKNHGIYKGFTFILSKIVIN